MNREFDIDLDFANRDSALALIEHVPAMMVADDNCVKHNTGVYVNPMPSDPLTGLATIDYKTAEQLGYVKLDLLNNSVYTLVKSPQHLDQLLAQQPNWNRLSDRSFVEQLVHINAHWDLMQQMPEPINSIGRMAMFLAVIRPAKRNLAGKTWSEVAKTVWNKPTDGSYYFKKAHAVSYSHLVAVHMNLIEEQQ
jgi:hypothetical protein